MPSKTKSLSLPEDLLRDAEARAQEMRFGSFSDYVQDLIRRDLVSKGLLQKEPPQYRTRVDQAAQDILDALAKDIRDKRGPHS